MNGIVGKLIEVIANAMAEHGNEFIVLFALLQLGLFIYIYIKISGANNLFYTKPENRVFHNKKEKNKNSLDKPLDSHDVDEILKEKKKLIKLYVSYANLTAIFPLLGILGTVASLILSSSETMMDSYMIALSTTLLGVFFAVVFKFLDAYISGPLDFFMDNADFAIQDYIRKNKIEETKDAE